MRGESDDEHELRVAGSDQEEPGCGEHDHREVEAAEPRAQVVLQAPLVYDEIDDEHDPRDDVDDRGEHGSLAAGYQDEGQDRREHERQREPLVETRECPPRPRATAPAPGTAFRLRRSSRCIMKL